MQRNFSNKPYTDKTTKSSSYIQIEGRNPVIETLRANKNIVKVYLQKGIKHDEKISEIFETCQKRGIKIVEIDLKSLTKMSHTEVHQGVIALKDETSENHLSLESLISKVKKSNRDPFFILVRESLYEHNLGAIIRTAVCAGVNGVILTHGSKISPQVVRTSMGATEYSDFCYSSIFDAIKTCQNNDVRVVGIEVSGDNFYYETNLKGPICLIIGGEDHPLSQEIIERIDSCVKIPMFSQINSLNMSVAAGIVLYEKVRQELI